MDKLTPFFIITAIDNIENTRESLMTFFILNLFYKVGAKMFLFKSSTDQENDKMFSLHYLKCCMPQLDTRALEHHNFGLELYTIKLFETGK